MEGTALGSGALRDREGVFFGYVALVGILALTLAAPFLADLPAFLRHAPVAFWLVAALAVLADVLLADGVLADGVAFGPSVPSGARPLGPVCPSLCFSFAALLSWGVGPAILIQAAAVTLSSVTLSSVTVSSVTLSSVRLRHRPWRIAFHAGRYALALVAAHVVAAQLGAVAAACGAVAGAVVWFAVDRILVAGAGRLRGEDGGWRTVPRPGRPDGRRPARRSRTAPDEALSIAALLLLGMILAEAGYRRPVLIPLVLVPLYAVGRMIRLSQQRDAHLRLDPLTGLLSRRALAAEVAAQALPGERFALLLLDLDRFKRVNDALGHEAGDRLLAAVAQRLTAAAQPGEVLARLGGDEIAMLTPVPVEDAGRRAARLAQVLAEPVVLDGLPLDVSGAIGVAGYPEHGTDPATLLRHAEVAMYDAKGRGDALAVYAPESDHNSPERLSLLADLRRALETRDGSELTFYYQPQVDLDSGEVIGVEALLRWHHPQRGPVDPEELIRVAEYSTVMRLLTHRVIDDVVAQLGRWAAAGVRLRASINVSVRDLHTTEVADRLADRLRRHGVGADQVQLEITEGALMADPRRVLATLRRLDRLGVALSLDDFGTGYSSMQHLRRLPLAEV
jgi:diguanylate cyclase (GGDEF)-like protein